MGRLGLSPLESLDNTDLKKPQEVLEEQKKNDPLGTERNGFLKTISENLIAIATTLGAPIKEKSSFDKSKEKTNIPSLDGAKDSEPKEGDTRQNPTTGKNEEFRGGKWVPDLSDSETKEEEKREQEEREERKGIFKFLTGGGLLTGLAGIFGGLNKGEKKETLFDKLKKGALGLLSTAGGFISNLLSPITNGISSLVGMLTGSGIGGLLKAGFEALVSSGALSTILTGAGMAWGLSEIHKNVEGTNKDSRVRNDVDPNSLKSSKDMSFIERAYYGSKDFQNIITKKNMNAYSSKDFVSEYAVDRGIKTTGMNLLSGMAFNGAIGRAGAKIVANTVGKIPIVGKTLAAPMGLASKIGSKLPEGANIFKNTASKL